MIEVNAVNISADAFQLNNVSLTVPTGAYAVLMGPTGCGKTTLLEAIAGLRAVTAGRITLGETDVTNLKPAARHIGYVPQDAALFNTMTVRDHLAFALAIRKQPRDAIAKRETELAELLNLTDLLDRKPTGLSGGERQRVALGRALSFQPPTLLLDEPLVALDEDTRQQMTDLLKQVQQRTGVTALHVTHHRADAERLADRWFEFRNGSVVEKGQD